MRAFLLAFIDPSTGKPFNTGYYALGSFFAGIVGFVAGHMAVFFYDNSRSGNGQEDKAANKKAASRVAWGMAIAFAVIWLMVQRSGPSE